MAEPAQFHRDTNRLPDYDYTGAGGYSITLITHRHVCMFGEITADQVSMNGYGDIVREEWLRTAIIRPGIILDEFVIMPNHIHGIIFITESVGAHSLVPALWGCAPLQDPRPPHQKLCAPLQTPIHTLSRPPRSLGSFIAGFKSIVTKRINIQRATPGAPVWQRNYYEHIVRDEQDLNRIRTYIRNNPLQWLTDPEYQTPSGRTA
jgi:putative transposase